MFVKQKKLMAKCRACGHEFQLDSTHRAGTHLMKQLPKEMSEIDQKKKEETKIEASEDGEKRAKKVEEAEVAEEEDTKAPGLQIDSEEIGKQFSVKLSHDECLVTTTESL